MRFESKIHRIALEDLYFVEAQKDYVVLHTQGGEYKILSSMKFMTEELGEVDFHRIHRSYIVRLDKISCMDGDELVLKGTDKKVPVGPSFRSPFLKGVRMV